MTLKTTAAAAAVTVLAALWGGACAWAAEPAHVPSPDSPLGRYQRAIQPNVPKGLLHKSLGIIEASGYADGQTTSTAFTDLDTVTRFVCTEPAGCTVIADVFAQVATPTNGNNFAVCTEVDGVTMSSCPTEGVLNVADDYRVGTNRGVMSVAKGNHQIHTQLYCFQTCKLAQWDASYNITTP